LGLLVIRKSPKNVDPSAIQKGPINAPNVRNPVAREKREVNNFPLDRAYILYYIG
jgi:hypothetical protein